MDSRRDHAPGRHPAAPRPMLRAREAVALTIGIVVGAGIFRIPSLVAGAAGNEWVFFAAWIVGGLLSIVGALCYAELAAAFPQAGGDYAYLKRAYGPRAAFLYGWSRLVVIQTGSVALLAFVAGDYLAQLFGSGPWSAPAFAALAVAALTAINAAGVRQGTTAQNWLTAIEVLGLLLVIVAGLAFAPAQPVTVAVAGNDTAIGLVLVFVLLTYGGWNEAVYVTAELRDARRLMPRVLVGSLVLIAALYLLVNLAYVRVLGLGGVAGSDAVAADLMRRVSGAPGAGVISALVVAAALTSANATMITGARSACALGRDFPALSFLGRWDARSGSPRMAMLVQGGLALLLVGLGALARDGFRVAVEYTAPVFWLFFLLVGVAVFVLRIREPDTPRPFRVPWYPLLPLVFCGTSAYLLYSSIAYTGMGALVGVAVLAVGGALLPYLRPSPLPQESTP